MSKVSRDEQRLLEVARKSLAEFLGREPTRQELWRVHLCFKRMAFTLIEYVDHQNYEERKNKQNKKTDDQDQNLEPGGPAGKVAENY